MSRRTSSSRTSGATTAGGRAASSNSSSSVNPISRVVPTGDHLKSLIALRDRLAAETDDTTWQRHKAECRCVCGMGDGRLLAALVKELRAVMAEIAAMPETEGRSKLDDIQSAVASLDEHRRARRPRAAGS